MRLSLELRPDGTTCLDMDTQGEDPRQLVGDGFQQWAWMAHRLLGGGTPDYGAAPAGQDGLPQASDEGRRSGQEDAILSGH